MNLGNTIKTMVTAPAEFASGATLSIGGQYYFGHDITNPDEWACRNAYGSPTSCYNVTPGMIQQNLDNNRTDYSGTGPCAYGPCYYDQNGKIRARNAEFGTEEGAAYEQVGLVGSHPGQFDNFLDGDFNHFGDSYIDPYWDFGIKSATGIQGGSVSTFLNSYQDVYESCMSDPNGCTLSEEEILRFERMRDEGLTFQELRDNIGLDPAEYLSVKYDDLLGTHYDSTAEEIVREAAVGTYGDTAKSAYDKFATEINTGQLSEENFASLVQASADYERQGSMSAILGLRDAYAANMNDRITLLGNDKAFDTTLFSIWTSTPESLEYMAEREEDWQQDYSFNPQEG